MRTKHLKSRLFSKVSAPEVGSQRAAGLHLRVVLGRLTSGSSSGRAREGQGSATEIPFFNAGFPFVVA